MKLVFSSPIALIYPEMMTAPGVFHIKSATKVSPGRNPVGTSKMFWRKLQLLYKNARLIETKRDKLQQKSAVKVKWCSAQIKASFTF